jgi:Fe-S cluster biogenesis protein NfuA
MSHRSPDAAGATNPRHIGDQVEALLGDLRSSLDYPTWAKVEETVSLVSALYGAGLARILDLLRSAAGGEELVSGLTGDELVATLLLLHGLHPLDMRARVDQALEKVRPYLHSHGGDVELLELDVEADAVRLRLLGSCDGCPSSAVTLRLSVESAIHEGVPEIRIIDVEGAAEPAPPEVVSTPVSLRPKPDRVGAVP